MTRYIDDKSLEIIPPSRVSTNSLPAPVVTSALPAPHRRHTGGIISSIPRRWEAEAQRKTYVVFEQRSVAEKKLVEADTALGRSLIEHARVRQEYSELPETLAADRNIRQLCRSEDVAQVCHQIQIAEAARVEERASLEVRLINASRHVLDAQQSLEAQRQFGFRLHTLHWSKLISEAEQEVGASEMRLREQEAIVAEHNARNGRREPSLDDLYALRRELSAEKSDTTSIDVAIAHALHREKGRGK